MVRPEKEKGIPGGGREGRLGDWENLKNYAKYRSNHRSAHLLFGRQ